MPPMVAPDLLVGASTMDDAAVYRVRDDLAIALTTDLFTPIVDDAYSFGAIAAANALSDLYAMGATPILALNLACWPRDVIPLDVLSRVQQGAADKVLEAGAIVAGGHSIDDPEPKFGLVALGTLHPDAISTNAGARPDDLLVVTKPLGTGIVTTAIKHDAASPSTVAKAIQSMSELNAQASAVARDHGAHAITDITGYGLLGHLRELLQASEVSAQIYADVIPVLPDVWELLHEGYVPGGTKRNLTAIENVVAWHPSIDAATRTLFVDAQTSGGLLIAIPPEDEAAMCQALKSKGVLDAVTIGRITAPGVPLIDVHPTYTEFEINT